MKTTKKNSVNGNEVKNSAKRNVYQIVTDKIVEQLSQGLIPWQKPWTYAGSGMTDLRNCAINYTTRKPYSMLNQWLLGFRAGEYLTYKQAEKLGGKVKKGAEGGMVVFWGSTIIRTKKKDEDVEDGDDTEPTTIMEEREVPVLKYYHVFHIDDIDGIESKYADEPEDAETEMPDPIDSAEELIWDYLLREPKLKFQNDRPSDRAYYSPAADAVVVPMISQYAVKEEYYSTTFHELTHSTLPAYRCDRRDECGIAAFGSQNYSREELVAEIGAAMLCNIAGIDCSKAFKNSVGYIQSWLRQLQNNPKWIVWAAARAEKAARYIQYGPEAQAQA